VEESLDLGLEVTKDQELRIEVALSSSLDLDRLGLAVNLSLSLDSGISREVLGDLVEGTLEIDLALGISSDNSSDKDQLKVVLGVSILVVFDLIDLLKGVGRDRGVGKLEIASNVGGDDVLSDGARAVSNAGLADIDAGLSARNLGERRPVAAEVGALDKVAIRVKLHETRDHVTNKTNRSLSIDRATDEGIEENRGIELSLTSDVGAESHGRILDGEDLSTGGVKSSNDISRGSLVQDRALGSDRGPDKTVEGDIRDRDTDCTDDRDTGLEEVTVLLGEVGLDLELGVKGKAGNSQQSNDKSTH
jgi:hypothetical protein